MKSANLFPISKNATFGERLTALREYNEIKSVQKLAESIFYTMETYQKTNDEEVNTATIEIIRKRIASHLKANCNPKMIYIKEYCDYFNCSADYLLGYINYPTHKQTDIGKETGLSPRSIKQLVKLPAIEQYILNCLLEKYPRLPELLKRIRQTIVYSTLDKDVHITLNHENSYYPDSEDVFVFASELNKYKK